MIEADCVIFGAVHLHGVSAWFCRMRHPEDTNIVQEIAHKARKGRLAAAQVTAEAEEAPPLRPPSRNRFGSSLLGLKRQSFEQQKSFELRQMHPPAPKMKKIVLPNASLSERSSNGRIDHLSGFEEEGPVVNGFGHESGGHADGDGIVEMQSYR